MLDAGPDADGPHAPDRLEPDPPADDVDHHQAAEVKALGRPPPQCSTAVAAFGLRRGSPPGDDSAACGNTHPGSGSSSRARRPRIVAGRLPCTPHALAWSPGLPSGVLLGNTLCEASAFRR